jgi:hypothetical protein
MPLFFVDDSFNFRIRPGPVSGFVIAAIVA